METPRRYIPATKLPDKSATVELDSTADLTFMLSSTLTILHREIKQINLESGKGKLSKDSSVALINYIKLLNELQTKEQELLEELNEAQLESLSAGTKAPTEL